MAVGTSLDTMSSLLASLISPSVASASSVNVLGVHIGIKFTSLYQRHLALRLLHWAVILNGSLLLCYYMGQILAVLWCGNSVIQLYIQEMSKWHTAVNTTFVFLGLFCITVFFLKLYC